MNEDDPDVLPTYYTPEQVAAAFGVSEHYVKRHMDTCPRLEIGRQTRFTAEHVRAIAKRHERLPTEPPATEAFPGQRTRRTRYG